MTRGGPTGAHAVADGHAREIDAVALRLGLVGVPDVVRHHRDVVPRVRLAGHEEVALPQLRPRCRWLLSSVNGEVPTSEHAGYLNILRGYQRSMHACCQQ